MNHVVRVSNHVQNGNEKSHIEANVAVGETEAVGTPNAKAKSHAKGKAKEGKKDIIVVETIKAQMPAKGQRSLQRVDEVMLILGKCLSALVATPRAAALLLHRKVVKSTSPRLPSTMMGEPCAGCRERRSVAWNRAAVGLDPHNTALCAQG